MKQRIYLDYAAATPLSETAFSAMQPYLTQQFGNAHSPHGFGAEAFAALDTARREIAELLGVSNNEIYFTSGGTEANNWALAGAVYAAAKTKKSPHIMVGATEHASVLSAAQQLSKLGACRVTVLGVDKNGFISSDALTSALTPDTCLISIMLANNEIGTIQPIEKLARIAQKNNIPFHTDAVAAAGVTRFAPKALGVSMLSVSAHKFYGPKGAGFLYIDNQLSPSPEPLITGGAQEHGKRGGTVNVPAVVGMAAAFKEAVSGMEEEAARLKALRDEFVRRVETEIPHVRYNGDRISRLPQNVNFSFLGIKSAQLIQTLDLYGIACAGGAACSAGDIKPSHVLTALDLPEEITAGAVRFSLGKFTTQADITYTVEQLKKAVSKLRGAHEAFKTTGSASYTV